MAAGSDEQSGGDPSGVEFHGTPGSSGGCEAAVLWELDRDAGEWSEIGWWPKRLAAGGSA